VRAGPGLSLCAAAAIGEIPAPDARVTLFGIFVPNPNHRHLSLAERTFKRNAWRRHHRLSHAYHCNNFLDTVDRFLESRIDYEILRSTAKAERLCEAFSHQYRFSGDAAATKKIRAGSFQKRNVRPWDSAQWIGVGWTGWITPRASERFQASSFFGKNPLYQGALLCGVAAPAGR